MQLVVDANILFAAILKPSTTRAILLLSGIDFYSPEFSVQEFRKHLPTLQKKTGLTASGISGLFDRLLEGSELSLVPFEDFSHKKQEAREISPDIADTAYFALALYIGCPIWSNDKALKRQDKVKIFSTKELLDHINKN